MIMQVIMTTENPKYKKLLDIDNKDLLMMMENLGVKGIHVEGCYGGVRENSVMFKDVDYNNLEILKTLAILSGQESIFYRTTGRWEYNTLFYVNGINKNKYHLGKSFKVSETPFEDNYTKIENLYTQYQIDFDYLHEED
jgi:hypothetical protein